MELPVASNAFQIKPDLENILHAGTVKQLIQKVLAETLLSKQEIVLRLFGTTIQHHNIAWSSHF